jgi:hypothetical protein
MAIKLGIGNIDIRNIRSGFSWSSYWANIISAIIADGNPYDVVLTFPSAKSSLGVSDFTIIGKTFSGAVWNGAVLTLTSTTAFKSTDGNPTIIFNKIGQTGIVTNNVTWSTDMMLSYLTINSHSTFSDPQKVLLKDRLTEAYIITTFGPAGTNKTVCDFFLFFENSNTTTNLTTRTNTKTGATLRWNYGAGNVYSQNNLPAQITNGVVTVTSTDGFGAWTSFDIDTNTFINHCPSFRYLTNVATKINIDSNGFTGAIPDLTYNTKAIQLLLGSNNFKTINTSLVGLTALQQYDVHSNPNLTGNFPAITGITTLTQIRVDGTRITGNIPDLSANTNFVYLSTIGSKITGLNGTIPSSKMTNLTFGSATYTSLLSSSEVGSIMHKLNLKYTASPPTANLLLRLEGAGNGALIGDEANADLVAVKALFVTAGKTLTYTYNAEATRFATGHVVFTHDDMWATTYSLAYPLLQSKGILATLFVTTDWIEVQHRLTWANMLEMSNAGHEVGGHGKTHTFFSSLTHAELIAELDTIDTLLAANGLPIATTFAYPYSCPVIDKVWIQAKCAEYYTLGRGTDSNFVTQTSDKMNMPFKLIEGNTTDTEAKIVGLEDIIDYCACGNCIVVFLFHEVVMGAPVGPQVNYAVLSRIFDKAISSGVSIIKFKDLIPLMP